MQLSSPPSLMFWHIDIGNVLTMLGVVGAWLISKVWDARGVKDELLAVKKAQTEHELEVEKWQAKYELESGERDKILRSLDIAVVQLKSLADFSERRLTLLESRDRPGSIERIHDRIDELTKSVKQ